MKTKTILIIGAAALAYWLTRKKQPTAQSEFLDGRNCPPGVIC